MNSTKFLCNERIDLTENYYAFMISICRDITPDECMTLMGINPQGKGPLNRANNIIRDAEIVRLRNSGVYWREIAETLGMERKAAQKAYQRRIKHEALIS